MRASHCRSVGPTCGRKGSITITPGLQFPPPPTLSLTLTLQGYLTPGCQPATPSWPPHVCAGATHPSWSPEE